MSPRVRTVTTTNVHNGKFIVIILFFTLLAFVLLRNRSNNATTNGGGNWQSGGYGGQGGGPYQSDGGGGGGGGGGGDDKRSSRDRDRRRDRDGDGDEKRDRNRDRDESSKGKEEDKKKEEAEKKKEEEVKEEYLPPHTPFTAENIGSRPNIMAQKDPRAAEKALKGQKPKSRLKRSGSFENPTGPRKKVSFIDDAKDLETPVTAAYGFIPNENSLVNMTDLKNQAAAPRKPHKPHFAQHQYLPYLDIDAREPDRLLRGIISDKLLREIIVAHETAKCGKEDSRFPLAMRDEWVKHFGPIPYIAAKVCQAIGQAIQGDIPGICEIMSKRQQMQPKKMMDSHRSVDAFILKRVRANIKAQEEIKTIGGPLFVVAWFVDWYRLYDASQKMAIDNEAVNMFQVLPPSSRLLAWIEAFAILCARQRLRATAGLDLYGLCLRAFVREEMIDRQLALHLDLCLFLPGGPDDAKTNLGGWYRNAMELSESVRHLRTEISNMYPDHIDGTRNKRLAQFESVRMIIRPGWPAEKIDVAQVATASGVFDSGGQTALQRTPEVMLCSAQDAVLAKEIASIITEPMRGVFPQLPPQQIIFHRKRQYSGVAKSMNDKSNSFTVTNIAAILRVLGPGLQQNSEKFAAGMRHEVEGDMVDLTHRGSYHTFHTIDTGGIVPLMQGQNVQFFPLAGYRRLSVLVLPYIPLAQMQSSGGSTDILGSQVKSGATASLILARTAGLHDLMLRPIDTVNHTYPLSFHISIKTGEVNRFASELILGIIENTRRKLLAVGGVGGRDQVNKRRQEARELGEKKRQILVARIKIFDPEADPALRGSVTAIPLPATVPWPADLQSVA